MFFEADRDEPIKINAHAIQYYFEQC